MENSTAWFSVVLKVAKGLIFRGAELLPFISIEVVGAPASYESQDIRVQF